MLELPSIDTYNLSAQVSRFANESLITYLIGLPIIFGILLLIYGIFKFVFAGSCKPDKDDARRLLWVSIIIIIVAILAYAIYFWIYGAANSATLPNAVE
ncbi:MAG: hypothetical protein PHW01_02605 [Patescibacteria group bacterium]|nr:hypothetical protein [Patescibacteria group bacterium]